MSLASRLDRSRERHVTNGVCLNMREGELGEYWSAILIKISRLPRFGLESLLGNGGYIFFYISLVLIAFNSVCDKKICETGGTGIVGNIKL